MKSFADTLVRGTAGPLRVNQHAPKYADRRTRRLRDRSGQKRWAIHRSRNDE